MWYCDITGFETCGMFPFETLKGADCPYRSDLLARECPWALCMAWGTILPITVKEARVKRMSKKIMLNNNYKRRIRNSQKYHKIE